MITVLIVLAALWLVAGAVVLASTSSPSQVADIALANRTPVVVETVRVASETSLAA